MFCLALHRDSSGRQIYSLQSAKCIFCKLCDWKLQESFHVVAFLENTQSIIQCKGVFLFPIVNLLCHRCINRFCYSRCVWSAFARTDSPNSWLSCLCILVSPFDLDYFSMDMLVLIGNLIRLGRSYCSALQFRLYMAVCICCVTVLN